MVLTDLFEIEKVRPRSYRAFIIMMAEVQAEAWQECTGWPIMAFVLRPDQVVDVRRAV